MKRKVIIACLIAAMTFGVFSGCDKKITEQSTFGNTPVTSTTVTTETTKEIHYEYATNIENYISVLHNNFPNINTPVSENANKVEISLNNSDFTWSIDNKTLSYNFPNDEITTPIVDRIEYVGYEFDKINSEDPIITNKDNTTIGTIYIKSTLKDEINDLYHKCSDLIVAAYTGEIDTVDTDTEKSIIVYTNNKENWIGKITLTSPSGKESCYVLQISVQR